MSNENIQIRSGPTYLIQLSNNDFFIAIRLDETPNTVRAVGFFINSNDVGENDYEEEEIETIIKNYNEIISKKNSSEIVEISFPWHRIDFIQNLIYKHKGLNK